MYESSSPNFNKMNTFKKIKSVFLNIYFIPHLGDHITLCPQYSFLCINHSFKIIFKLIFYRKNDTVPAFGHAQQFPNRFII